VTTTMQPPHWADVLTLRPEVTNTQGQVANLQMSLYGVSSMTADVPYRDVGYYADITMPTAGLVGFMAQVAQRLGSANATRALFHLDQGMGGGKSHALVGLYHLARDPGAFLTTELGRLVRVEAEERANGPIDLAGTRVVVLPADHMTPGATSSDFGPATSLHERFVWSLFPGDFDRYRKLVAAGPDKAALQAALREAGGPVLILLDELMDYAQLLSDAAHRGTLPGEQAFLNSLMDAADELPRVAVVVVMIRSERDDRGYLPEAEAFRDYVARRLARNGTTAAVTDAQDLAAIIRRRIFEQQREPLPTVQVAAAWSDAADRAWIENVFDKLPSTRSPVMNFQQRVEATYPFHPDLMALVREDWSQHAGFQHVRSTVDIFAATAFYWANEHQAGRYAPALIGVGDLPLHRMIESVLSSGLLHANEKAVQGFRAVAAADVIAKDGTKGRAVELDELFHATHPGLEPAMRPCVELATALLLYSLVPRARARPGAIKPELLAALFRPGGLSYTTAAEALDRITDIDEGLGSLQVIPGAGGRPTRYQLTISQTLQMFYRQAKGMVAEAVERQDDYIWDRVQAIAAKGPFDKLLFIESRRADEPLEELFANVDEVMTNRLVVLDPRRWSRPNGRETRTLTEVQAVLGLGERALRVDNAASAVVACINGQRREQMRRRAIDALAYQIAEQLLGPDDELRAQAHEEWRKAQGRLDEELQRAYQWFAYLTRASSGTVVEWHRFDTEQRASLSGHEVWEALVERGRAARSGELDGKYLDALLDLSERNFTLREVVRRFWQDSAFPLVASVADVRVAIHDAVEVRKLWQILGSTGEVIGIPSPAMLAINAPDQTVRKAPREAGPEEEVSGDGSGAAAGGEKDQEKPAPRPVETYTRYALRLPSRSLIQQDTRTKVFNLLSQAADDLDPTSGVDVQLIDLTMRLTAADGSLDGLRQKAAAIEAQWSEEPDEF
jgi:hypothetical protein